MLSSRVFYAWPLVKELGRRFSHVKKPSLLVSAAPSLRYVEL